MANAQMLKRNFLLMGPLNS